jgi:hypothetical protein
MSSPGWAKIRESAALLAELGGPRKKRSAPAGRPMILTMRGTVSACASRLFVISWMKRDWIDVDGSQEMLNSRLEEGENEGGSSDENN